METIHNVAMGVLAGTITAAIMALIIVVLQTNKRIMGLKRKKSNDN